MPFQSRPTRRVWILTSSGSELIDTVGPFEVLHHATSLCRSGGYELTVVSAAERTVEHASGLGLRAHATLADAVADGLPHTILVGGGRVAFGEGSEEDVFARWLARHAEFVPRIAAVCTGAFVLGAADLLDGRRATTHWALTRELAERHPRARVVEDRIFVRDGKITTSAGMSAGIDMTLALVEEDFGHELAAAVARYMVLFLRRSGGQRQFSIPLLAQDTDRSELRDLQAFVVEHLAEPLPVERLAERANTSPRTLTRWFRREFGMGPGEYVRKLRLEEAKRLLEDTELSIAEIARRAGLADESTLRRHVQAELGVSPREYRKRFRRLAPADLPAAEALPQRLATVRGFSSRKRRTDGRDREG